MAFCPKISGGGRDLQMILLVRTITECRDTQTLLAVKIFFELFALPGGGDANTLGGGVSSHTWAQTLAPNELPGGISTT